jgi:hypothetical protein
MDVGNGEGTKRVTRDHRFRSHRIRQAREELLFGNERVEEAVRKELVELGLGDRIHDNDNDKRRMLVEVGLVERAEL